jgi:ketosteroid isomerase-like protein
MSTELNKQLAREFFARFATNDVAGALDAMTDDATWWIVGKRACLPAAGEHSKQEIARIFYTMAREMEKGLKMSIKGLLAEDDKVAIELESHGVLRNGRVYNNEYHILMKMRDGKICAVREYLDTQHVHATWFEREPT